jgi:hypothetical protein
MQMHLLEAAPIDLYQAVLKEHPQGHGVYIQ